MAGCAFQHTHIVAFPLICLAIARHLLPSERRHLWSCVFSILGCTCQLSQSAASASRIQLCPQGSGQRSWTQGLAKPDRRGKAGSERRKACFHPGGSGFHLPCEMAKATPCFHPIDFYVTHRFFVTFFPEESNVPPSSLSPRPLLFLYRLIVRGAAQEHIFQRVRGGGQAHQGHLQPA